MTTPTFTATPTSGMAPLAVQFTDTTPAAGTVIWNDTFDGTGTLATHVSNDGVTYFDMYGPPPVPGQWPSVADCIVNNGEVHLDGSMFNDVIVQTSVTPPLTYTTEVIVRTQNGNNSYHDYLYLFAMDADDNWYGPETFIKYNNGNWQVDLYVSSPTDWYDSGWINTGNTDGYATPKLTIEVIDNSIFKMYFDDVLIATSQAFTDMPPLPKYGFDIHNSMSNTPMYVGSINAYTPGSGPTAWQWDFGDGKISTQQNPTHVYKKDGVYTVKFKALIDGIWVSATPQTVTATTTVELSAAYNTAVFMDDQGNAIAGGKLFTYTSGGYTNKLATYADADGLIKNPNPIILDADGQVTTPIWLRAGGTYNMTVTLPDGETVVQRIQDVVAPILIAGEHIGITPTTGYGNVTISSEAPPYTYGHGDSYLFWLMSQSTFQATNTVYGDWSVLPKVPVVTDNVDLDVEWNDFEGAFVFNTPGSYTIEVLTDIGPEISGCSTPWPMGQTVFGSEIFGDIAVNPIKRSSHDRYTESWGGNLPDTEQRTTFFDTFTISANANATMNYYVYADHGPDGYYTDFTANTSIIISRFGENYGPPDGAPPVASFVANVTTGDCPLTVQFTDTSTGDPTSWLWNFGDSTTSTEQNPVHTYECGLGDNFSPELTAANIYGSGVNVMLNYVVVTNPTLRVAANVTYQAPTDTVEWTVTTSNVPDGTIVYWTMSGTDIMPEATMDYRRFTDTRLSGQVIVYGNTATFTRTLQSFAGQGAGFENGNYAYRMYVSCTLPGNIQLTYLSTDKILANTWVYTISQWLGGNRTTYTHVATTDQFDSTTTARTIALSYKTSAMTTINPWNGSQGFFYMYANPASPYYDCVTNATYWENI